MSLTLSMRVLDGHSVVQVGGEVDLCTAPELRSGLLGAMAYQRDHLILDLGGVSFMDARGLAVLVVLHQRAQRLDVSFRIAAASEMILKQLRITGLARHFALYATVAAALSA